MSSYPLRRAALRERTLLAIIALVIGVLLFAGWRVFWFLTDDAFIAFRYVSNSRFGYGYVWNAPPFLPVEGYTSFLWVVVLDGVWRALGVEPPASANWIALGFSYATFLLAAVMVCAQSKWRDLNRFSRAILVGLLGLFLVSNRTFLAWSSSGLETAMWDFFLILWVYVSLSKLPPRRRACLAALFAAATELIRPEGILFCACTAVLVVLLAFREPSGRRRIGTLVFGFLPFAIAVAHIAWRLSFYGAWLPNTYYAKVTEAWPESGIRYALSFVLEYALWLPIGVIGWAVLRVMGAGWSQFRASALQKGNRFAVRDTIVRDGPVLVVVGALLLHLGYYTLIVGGDHFEYRIYAHLVPLTCIALVWALARLQFRWRNAVATLLACLTLSMPVQWTHWMLTRDISTRAETGMMRVPIAPHWPAVVRWYADWFDEMQSWMIGQLVCVRHQEHKVFWQFQTESWPSREDGMKLPPDGYPVAVLANVGYPSWVLPHVNIIDTLGLNDYVIARTPVPAGTEKLMAHMHRPPKGYLESYQPNVVRDHGHGRVVDLQRPQPLTRSRIVELEEGWRNRLRTVEP